MRSRKKIKMLQGTCFFAAAISFGEKGCLWWRVWRVGSADAIKGQKKQLKEQQQQL